MAHITSPARRRRDRRPISNAQRRLLRFACLAHELPARELYAKLPGYGWAEFGAALELLDERQLLKWDRAEGTVRPTHHAFRLLGLSR